MAGTSGAETQGLRELRERVARVEGQLEAQDQILGNHSDVLEGHGEELDKAGQRLTKHGKEIRQQGREIVGLRDGMDDRLDRLASIVEKLSTTVGQVAEGSRRRRRSPRDRKSTRLNSSHSGEARMPSSA